MNLTGKIVQSETRLPENGGAFEQVGHVMRHRVRVVRTGYLIDRNSRGNGTP
jgi:hypothetical protein